MPSPSVVVIAGSPAAGKSTLMTALAEHLDGPPAIEFSAFRAFHLDPEWRRQNPIEEAMSFDNLVFVITNYLKRDMTPVLVTDLRENRVDDLIERYGDHTTFVVSLFADDEVIRSRIASRSDGFTDVAAAVAWNDRVRLAPLRTNEARFETSSAPVAELMANVASVVCVRR